MITAGEKQWALLIAADQLDRLAADNWIARHQLGWSEYERGQLLRVAEILRQLHLEVGQRRTRATRLRRK